jgi:aspartokinase-like uncharacterized kinase
MNLVVVKVGGSLFDLPELGPRLLRWLPSLDAQRVLLVPGGGAAANAVRDLCRTHKLDDEEAHWLALRAVQLNAHFLAGLLGGLPVVADPRNSVKVCVLDGFAFAHADETQPGCLPHTWAATSDSLAARAARVAGATRLILLKSITIPPQTPWTEAARHGWVDEAFAGIVGSDLDVECVNFRIW